MCERVNAYGAAKKVADNLSLSLSLSLKSVLNTVSNARFRRTS